MPRVERGGGVEELRDREEDVGLERPAVDEEELGMESMMGCWDVEAVGGGS